MRSSHLTTEFKEKISAYVDENNVQLVYNDSQTLEASLEGAKKSKQGKEGVSLSVICYTLRACLEAKRSTVSKGLGQRPHHGYI